MKLLTNILLITLSFSFILACKDKVKEESTEQMELHEEMGYEPASISGSEVSFEDQEVSEIVKAYIALKDALVETDGEKAKEAAQQLLLILPNNSSEAIAFLKNEAQKVSETNDTEAQRSSFDLISESILVLVKNSMITEGKLFKQYCPMAKNNEGAFWLSTSIEIRNPYFGDKMLNCGSVEEEI